MISDEKLTKPIRPRP